jgi:SAM-dependent methyltransferase
LSSTIESSPADPAGEGARAGSANAAVQARHFAVPARSAPRMAPGETAYVRRHLETALRAARVAPGGRILELGAGMGRFSLALAERGFEVTACDLSAPLLEVLAAHDPGGRVRRVVADAAEVERHVRGPFDAVVGFFFLHHLPRVDDVFRASARLLAPGGRAVFCEPHAWHAGFYFQIALTPGMRWSADRGVARMRRGPLEAALRRTGLAPIAEPSYGLLPPRWVAGRAGAALERGLERLPRWLLPRAFLPIAGERRS